MEEDDQVEVDVVYSNTIDNGRFTLTVTRTDDYQGCLKLTVTESGEVLISEEVGLSYGARFGPDVADVADWQERSIVAVDEWIEENDA